MTAQRLKALFITHDTSAYGASRSLQLLLRNYDHIDADLLVQRPLLGRQGRDLLRTQFGRSVRLVREAFLPFDTCYQFGSKDRLFNALLSTYNRVLWGGNRRSVERMIDSGSYDFIHLNSLVLHALITERHPFILHMRDVYDGTNPIAVENVRKAAGVIFIDEATLTPFRAIPLQKSLVLNNPFDMTAVAEHAKFRPGLPGLDVERHTIYSIIGVANDAKGTGFIIQTFLSHQDRNARLLVVAGRERTALASYHKLARNDQRIIFWGEEPDIARVYSISDYIIRGEAFPCIGRTVYEGLYSGCRVIVPGDPLVPPPMFEYEDYRKDIFFYRPRNADDLLTLLRRLTGCKVGERKLRSNVAEYVRAFHAFVLSTLAEPRGNEQ